MKLIPTSTNPVTITLYRNYPFDNSYSDTCLLSRKFTYNGNVIGADSNSFLDLKNSSNQYIFPRTSKTGTYNFAFGNGLVTSLVLELNDDEINSNYIKVECSVSHEVYYYFITQIIQKNETTYLVNLELDVFMTYGDNFLDALKNIPVMTERKHCMRTTSSGYPKCSDLVKQDSMFTGVKANIEEETKELELGVKDYLDNYLDNYNWCYIIRKIDDSTSNYAYKENDIYCPYIVLCFPMVTMKFYRVVNGVDTLFFTLDPNLSMKLWANHEYTYKISILPYPPFHNLGSNVIISQDTSELKIRINDSNLTNITTNEWYVDFTDVRLRVSNAGDTNNHHCVIINGYGGALNYKSLRLMDSYTDLDSTTPSIQSGKNKFEYKLYLPPFREYKLRSFADDGVNINPQLRFNKSYKTTGMAWDTYRPLTIVTSNPDNTSYFTTMRVQSRDVESKIGLGTSYYYSMPTSYTALQHFLNTASAEYNNSKLINGLKGIASMGLGGAGIGYGIGNEKTSATMAGTASVVGGAITLIDNITSYYAKMEDLKNTPSNLTTGGSTFTLDYAMALHTDLEMYPYITIYCVDKSVEKCGSEYFYKFGYEVNRECYFNTELKVDETVFTCVNIFNRTLFNYVKLSEDITIKLIGYNSTSNTRSGIPQVIAKKFSEILMRGVTIWNFFGFTTIQNKVNTTGVYDVFRYFQKCDYCNAEFYNQSY